MLLFLCGGEAPALNVPDSKAEISDLYNSLSEYGNVIIKTTYDGKTFYVVDAMNFTSGVDSDLQIAIKKYVNPVYITGSGPTYILDGASYIDIKEVLKSASWMSEVIPMFDAGAITEEEFWAEAEIIDKMPED